jgi:hypothetical protein
MVRVKSAGVAEAAVSVGAALAGLDDVDSDGLLFDISDSGSDAGVDVAA